MVASRCLNGVSGNLELKPESANVVKRESETEAGPPTPGVQPQDASLEVTSLEREPRAEQSHQPESASPAGSNVTAKDAKEADDDSQLLQTRTPRLVGIVKQAKAELFHDPQEVAFIALPIDGRRQVWQVESKEFRKWLAYKSFQANKAAPSDNTLNEAVQTLVGESVYQGPEKEVHIRLAEHEGKIYLDLGDPTWRAVEVDTTGWRIVDLPPVYFRRPPGMRPLPEPQQGGNLRKLRDILNLGDERNWKFIVGWLLSCFLPKGPYPLLFLHGQQGSAKSTVTRAIRRLIDPHVVEDRSRPPSERDLAIAAKNNRIIAFDNLSSITDYFSDMLCRLSTGSGSGIRQNYTDDQEVLFKATRPVILNGISAGIVRRPDLQERTLFVELPTLPDEERRTEAEVWQQLDMEHPRLLGALLDAVVVGCKIAAPSA
jgi:hypothetical protein